VWNGFNSNGSFVQESLSQMADFALDTSVVVDLLIGYTPATMWMNNQINTIFGVSSVVVMEALKGTPNRPALLRKLKFLKQFEMIETRQEDFDWAFDQFIKYHLSHSVEWQDCIIAAPCHRLNLTLYTRNLKHLTPILGTLVQSPY
jgi:predicted nucleic acid-binding protein